MVNSVLVAKAVILACEKSESVAPIVTKLVVNVLRPFMVFQNALEGSEYVTGSLLLPFVKYLQTELNEVLTMCGMARWDTRTSKVKHEAVERFTDFIAPWGDSVNVETPGV